MYEFNAVEMTFLKDSQFPALFRDGTLGANRHAAAATVTEFFKC
jgi:hypothetical protein